MRFTLKTLLLATLVIALFTAIAVWNPLFGGLIMLVGGPLALFSLLLWNHPSALLICTLSAATFFFEASLVSYNGTRCIDFKPYETCYACCFTQGRFLFFRYEKWLPPVRSRYYSEPPSTDWKTWGSYPPPNQLREFAGCEYAKGKFTDFLTSDMRHHSFDYTMIGIPIWLIATLLLAPAIARRIWIHRVFESAAVKKLQSQQSSEDNSARLIEFIFCRISLVSILLSVFLTLGLVTVIFDLPSRPTQLPNSYLIVIQLLLLAQGVLADFHENRLPKKFSCLASIMRYALVAAQALLTASHFWLIRVEVLGPLSDDTSTFFSALRLALSLALSLGAIIMSQPFHRPSQRFLQSAALVTASICFSIAVATYLFDFHLFTPSQFEIIHFPLIGLAILSLLLQVTILAVAFAEIEKDPPQLLLFLALILAFGAALFLLEPDLDPNPTRTDYIKGIWQLRLTGLLAISGLCTYFLVVKSASSPDNSR